MTRAQKFIAGSGALTLLLLILLPPWRQVAEKETDYAKDLGRAFVFRPPTPVAVDCYFAGCKTAPGSYFHVLLYRELLYEQLVFVAAVVILALWVFRFRQDGRIASLVDKKIRVTLSVLLALLVPPLGTFPLASYMLDIPRQIANKNELWLIPSVLIIVLYLICASVIYGILTFTVKVVGRWSNPL